MVYSTLFLRVILYSDWFLCFPGVSAISCLAILRIRIEIRTEKQERERDSNARYSKFVFVSKIVLIMDIKFHFWPILLLICCVYWRIIKAQLYRDTLLADSS